MDGHLAIAAREQGPSVGCRAGGPSRRRGTSLPPSPMAAVILLVWARSSRTMAAFCVGEQRQMTTVGAAHATSMKSCVWWSTHLRRKSARVGSHAVYSCTCAHAVYECACSRVGRHAVHARHAQVERRSVKEETRRVDRALRVAVELLARLGGRTPADLVKRLVARDERRILCDDDSGLELIAREHPSAHLRREGWDQLWRAVWWGDAGRCGEMRGGQARSVSVCARTLAFLSFSRVVRTCACSRSSTAVMHMHSISSSSIAKAERTAAWRPALASRALLSSAAKAAYCASLSVRQATTSVRSPSRARLPVSSSSQSTVDTRSDMTESAPFT